MDSEQTRQLLRMCKDYHRSYVLCKILDNLSNGQLQSVLVIQTAEEVASFAAAGQVLATPGVSVAPSGAAGEALDVPQSRGF